MIPFRGYTLHVRPRLIFGVFLFLTLWYSCNPEPVIADLAATPPGFPELVSPADNSPTPKRIALGRKLFYDPILSRDSSISCASCHRQEFAFALDSPVAIGYAGKAGTRNVPTLGNIGWHPALMREGGVPTLEQQVAVPVQEAHEFNFSFPGIVGRLKASPEYVALCRDAYGREPDAYCVTRALGAFQRTLVTADSDWDRYFLKGEPGALSKKALRGWKIFRKLGCGDCHAGFDFTDHGFYNIGLYMEYPDAGRFRLTGDSTDMGKFKTPTLRNVVFTAPYMHDGSMQTLDEVIDHFAKGGRPHTNRSEKLQPFALGDPDRKALLAFLASLSDPGFLVDPRFSEN